LTLDNTNRLLGRRSLRLVLDLLIGTAAFLAVVWAYATVTGQPADFLFFELSWSLTASILAFWVTVQIKEDQDFQTFGIVLFVTGVGVILQGVFAYLHQFTLMPLSMLLAASVTAGAFVMFERRWEQARRDAVDPGVLVVGFDSVAHTLLPYLRPRVLGALGCDPALLPAGLPFLGSLESLPDVVSARRPSRIVLALEDWPRRLSSSFLLDCRLSGIVVEEAASVYEKLLYRVRCDHLAPHEFLFSSSSATSRPAIVFQAVYSNLFGLLLLIGLSPVILATALAVALFSGPGPVFENIACYGYQGIPFQLRGFRTRRRDGTPSAVGRLITRLHLVDLPQLINIIRGELAPFGPQPVRYEFARRLSHLVPYHLHRFSVKPGMFGWAQFHRPSRGIADEFLRLEYDFYYIKNMSIALDVELFLQSLANLFPWQKPLEKKGTAAKAP
jgi:lipopolysaccharide/colanic/teichoic acid biosynthesis glycosyltransferase